MPHPLQVVSNREKHRKLMDTPTLPPITPLRGRLFPFSPTTFPIVVAPMPVVPPPIIPVVVLVVLRRPMGVIPMLMPQGPTILVIIVSTVILPSTVIVSVPISFTVTVAIPPLSLSRWSRSRFRSQSLLSLPSLSLSSLSFVVWGWWWTCHPRKLPSRKGVLFSA